MRKKIIVIFGIDGTGKTTVAQELKKRLEKKYSKKVDVAYMGLAKEQRLPLLKPLMRIYFRLKWNGKSESRTYKVDRDWHRERKFSWLLVYSLELWAKFISTIIKSKSEYIICDRYFYDGLFYANEKNFKIFRKIIPKPYLSFILVVPAKKIMNRKNEADVKSIKKFYERADKISKYFKIEKINNDRRIDLTVSEILKKIKNEN